MKKEPLDWTRIGRNIRQARFIRGYSQEEFARKTEVSITTLYHIEQGTPVSRRSFEKICETLEISPDVIQARNRSVLTEADDFLIFRYDTGVWMMELQTGKKLSPDHLNQIQDPQERLRLGRLGLVPVFFCTTDFIMPEGPGVVLLELHSRYASAFNATIYRDCLLTCNQGGVRLMIGEKLVELRPGDIVGYRSKELRWMEPLNLTGPPARLTWTGAVRMGTRPDTNDETVRTRRRYRPRASAT